VSEIVQFCNSIAPSGRSQAELNFSSIVNLQSKSWDTC